MTNDHTLIHRTQSTPAESNNDEPRQYYPVSGNKIQKKSQTVESPSDFDIRADPTSETIGRYRHVEEEHLYRKKKAKRNMWRMLIRQLLDKQMNFQK
jgi:hypothetical protein